MFTHYLTDGNYSQPDRCRGTKKKECRSRNFTMRKEKVRTIFMQRIKIQEIDSAGRTPRQIVCEMRENMIGKIITGETIKLSGIIRT
jgi:DNA replicative helicase MCM subunit Mcm2 (Cdc46/Mcm family)